MLYEIYRGEKNREFFDEKGDSEAVQKASRHLKVQLKPHPKPKAISSDTAEIAEGGGATLRRVKLTKLASKLTYDFR